MIDLLPFVGVLAAAGILLAIWWALRVPAKHTPTPALRDVWQVYEDQISQAQRGCREWDDRRMTSLATLAWRGRSNA